MRARCYLVWTRDAVTRLRPDLHLISFPASDWSVRPPARLWLADTAPTPLAAWIWSEDLICVVQTDNRTAYLSPLYPHCYHTLSLSPSVSAASYVGAAETRASHWLSVTTPNKLNRCPKFVEKINDRGQPLFSIFFHCYNAWHKCGKSQISLSVQSLSDSVMMFVSLLSQDCDSNILSTLDTISTGWT